MNLQCNGFGEVLWLSVDASVMGHVDNGVSDVVNGVSCDGVVEA